MLVNFSEKRSQLKDKTLDGNRVVHTTKQEPVEVDCDLFLQQVIDASVRNVAVLDESGALLFANRSWLHSEQQTRMKFEPDAADGGWSCVNGQLTDLPDALIADIQPILDGREREFHKEYHRVNGSNWFLMHLARLNLPGSNRFRVLVTREDVTRHRQAEETLHNLTGRLINGQEEERRRVARELHDDLNQRLAILSIEIEQLGQKMPKDSEDLNASVRTLRNRTQEISTEIHRLSYQLHPAKLDHLGLAAALKSLCEEISEHHKINIEFRQDGPASVLPRDVTLCLFRVAQESLRNITKHSGASKAKVEVTRASNEIRLRVSDLGCGFDVRSPQTQTGLGLISMRERLHLVGGTISIRSSPISGTQIDVVVPQPGHRNQPEAKSI